MEPRLGAEAFSCPHCGALAHQSWSKLGLLRCENKERPRIQTYEQMHLAKTPKDADQLRKWQGFLDRLNSNVVTFVNTPFGRTDFEFVNFCVSECFSCKAFAIWVEDRIVYPSGDAFVAAHEAMPTAVKADFEEASAIVNRSPRGAAALLRLCVQNLMKELGEPGDDTSEDIASQVRKGLDTEVEQALELVRAVGNNAVHPGHIDLKDDKATAVTLFELVNMIVERRIAVPRKIAALFAGLPQPPLKAIEKKGAKKA